MNDVEVRKLPKKTIYIIVGLIILGILAAFAISYSQKAQMEAILKKLGYEDVSSITIYNKTPVTNDKTKVRGDLSKIKFVNNNTQKECFGFILKNKKTGEYTKDLDCK